MKEGALEVNPLPLCNGALIDPVTSLADTPSDFAWEREIIVEPGLPTEPVAELLAAEKAPAELSVPTRALVRVELIFSSLLSTEAMELPEMRGIDALVVPPVAENVPVRLEPVGGERIPVVALFVAEAFGEPLSCPCTDDALSEPSVAMEAIPCELKLSAPLGLERIASPLAWDSRPPAETLMVPCADDALPEVTPVMDK